MICFRPSRLTSAVVCLQGLFILTPAALLAQAPAAQQSQPPAQAQGQTQQPPPKQPNPFENVPESKEPEKPQPQQTPKPETPPPAPAPVTPTAPGEEPKLPAPVMALPSEPAGSVIERVEFRGARRVPAETLRALIFTKPGDPYVEDTLHRDFMALWNTNRFDDLRLEAEPGEKGIVLRFVVTERSVIRTINYEGAKSVSTSDILDRFKERKVGLSVESQYDPAKVQFAAVVLKELVAEHGHQFATVTPQLRRIPPNSLEVIFKVDEGPKVKVGVISPHGNDVFSDKEVIRAMKNLKPIGVPHGLFLENLFDRTYDGSKLDEDKERVRQAYQDRGYWFAKVIDSQVVLRDVGGTGRRIPVIHPNKPGKRADISLTIEEGDQQHLEKVNYVGVKLFKTPDVLTPQIFQMRPGDVFSASKLRKGIENLKKLYADFGYIDFVPEPAIDPGKDKDTIELTMNIDEGKQFFVRRIDFVGNTTTRDKVIRREILLDEGDIYSGRLWDASILRLNQLGYFEVLKENESYDIKRNPNSNTIDITLKVKEKGKNSIGINGGVSGIAGTFVGFNYSTNNFLGMGETLSLSSQLGTRTKDVSLSFSEPYFLDTRMQFGVVAYIRQFNYDQGREYSILSGQNVIPFYNSLGSNNVLNYVQNSKGLSLSVSYPIKRSFARLGLTIGYDTSNIDTKSTGAANYFQYINFSSVSGPSSLVGIKTAKIVPSYQYNSKNHPISPTQGKSIYISTEFAGSIFGANVNTIRPSVDIQYFHRAPAKISNKHVLAFHVLGSMLTGYNGRVAPPFQRTYIGGEQDVRGFDFYGISPIGFIPNTATVNLLNDDGTQRYQTAISSNGVKTSVAATQNIPYYQVITPGGDTQLVTNFEYRIPILGPVTLAPFMDTGINRILFPNQLSVEPDRVSQLNSLFPEAGFDTRVRIAKGTQSLRMSTGLELQVMLPVVNAPFRVYYAFNPISVREYIQSPTAVTPSDFPNAASYLNAVNTYGRAYPFFERRGIFRFTIGRTF